ncbi:MAG: tetratricopeptide repeat protein [Nitrospiraceae bacterium]
MIPRAAIKRMPVWLVTWMLMLLFGGSAVKLLVALDRQRPSLARAGELSYLPKGEYLKVAVLGYRQLAADLIWLKVVQHLGDRNETKAGYRWAYHAVDVLTDLDPKFSFAYLAGGTVLGVWAGLVQESIELLTKGMRYNPQVWQLPFTVGYDYYYELHDVASAAKYFRIAAMLPGCPEFVPKLAARMTVAAGDPDAALEFLQRFHQQVQDERLREAIEQRMKEVIAERDIRFLEEAVRHYQARYRKRPTRLEDLVTRGIIAQLPVEPFGKAYQLKASDGTVSTPGLPQRLQVFRR